MTSRKLPAPTRFSLTAAVVLRSDILTPMTEQERNITCSLAFLMNEVYLEMIFVTIYADRSRKLRERVELCFGFAPVMLFLPVLYDSLQIVKRHTVLPIVGEVRFAWKCREA